MKKKNKQLLLIVISIFGSIILPILILQLFYILFAEFYTKGFLTGIGHLFVCGIMIIVNIVGSQILIQRQYNRVKKNIRRNIFIIITVSIILQVGLSIMIENPFKDPPLPTFT
ncbi:polyferredoxin [Paenibacillus turicensis]|uniref:Polyferredoxin n=1 Tax=Paenibacillus turicensis TaxID=160487 RepID=A0ABS4FUT5_9BACL|nr:hypothetical protein [Paenibacillus turicensis]MBP1906334.1 polyferredoxin [Paenibacillus turicensis]